MNIFVSSTYEDLKEERKEAIGYIDRIGHSVAMEKFFASSHQSKDVCLRKLQECDAIILIFGFKYGSIDSEEGISFTEIEYNIAKTLGLPVFVFLKHGSDGTWGSDEFDSQRKSKLLSLKSRLDSERFRVPFTNPQDLSTEIAGAIHNYEREHGIIGLKLPAFANYEEFFRPFTDRAKLFNHLYSLVGREDNLKAFYKFVESDKRVGILYGRGGTGKSKLIFEFGKKFEKKHPEWKIRFLKEGITLSAEAIKQLPAKKCVIIVDDAHRRDDLNVILAVGQQFPDRIKTIFSSRPQGRDYLRGALTIAAYDQREIESFPEIDRLSIDEMEKLAGEILGENNRRLIEPLLRVSRDSPLVLAIGGKLVAEGSVAPAMLERHDEFQRVVFDRYQEALTGRVSDRIGRDLCKDLLSLISAISPIRPQNESFQKAASEFLNIETTKLIDTISILESSGTLLRRGYSLRITPDVLSDHILHKASITEQRQPTGYAQTIFKAFGPVIPGNVLFNLSELDWRVTREGKPVELLEEIWSIIWNDFKEATHSLRTQLLEIIQKTAHLQPGKTLELLEYAMKNPSKTPEDERFLGIYEYSHKDVLNKLPKVLKAIALNLDYLPRCCDILWELGRGDKRETGPLPEHPMRILADLAGYDVGKPVTVNKILLDSVEKWLKESDAHEHMHSPLDVLDPLLAKEGDSARSRGHDIVFKPFAVSFDNTRTLRERAISLLSSCLESGSKKVILRGVKSLANTLNPPHGLFGRTVSEGEIAQWLPEQITALEAIGRLAKKTKDPIIHLQIASELNWHAKRNSQIDVRDKANEILESIPDSFDLRVHRCISYSYDRDWDDEEHQEYQKRVRDEIKITATEIIKIYANGRGIFKNLDDILNRFEECGIRVMPGYLLYEISAANCELAIEISKMIVSKPSSPLSGHLMSLLSGIREKSKSEAIDIIRKATDTKDTMLCSSIAYGYSWGRWIDPIVDDEIEIIRKLLGHQDKEVRRYAIESLRNFPGDRIEIAVRLALEAKIENDERLGNVLCEILDEKHGISPDKLTDDQLMSFLMKLEGINKIDSSLYYLDKFLGYCSNRVPETVVEYLIKRLDLDEDIGRARNFQPLPYTGFSHGLQGISSSPKYTDILKNVRERALSPKSHEHFWIPKLFSEISGGFSAKCINILREWTESGDKNKIETVAYLLENAPTGFVFSHSGFVSELLENAYKINDGCYRNVSSCLYCSAVSGTRTGSAGQPMPQDVTLKKQAMELLKKYPAGSPTYKFYFSLIRHAENAIRDQLARDEELFVG